MGDPVLSSVLAKTLWDQRRALLGWSLSVALLIAMYVALWPTVRDQPSMSDILDQMPEAFRALFASSGADMSTPTGYVQVELLSFMGPAAVMMYAIGAGAGAIGGEEDRHTLDLLLSNPVSRSRVVLDKFLAMATGTFLIAAVMGVALVAEGDLVGLDLPAGKVAATMLHLALLGTVFGAMALTLSAATGKTGISKGVPALVAVVAYIVNGLAPLVDWLEEIQGYSPFYQHIGHDPLRNGLDAGSVAISAATAVVLLALAVLGFRRRDVGA